MARACHCVYMESCPPRLNKSKFNVNSYLASSPGEKREGGGGLPQERCVSTRVVYSSSNLSSIVS